jgi:DNA-binding transcriptional MerR regulator
MTHYLVRRTATVRGWTVEEFADAAGLHPDLVRRLVTLGLLAADTDAGGRLRLPTAELARAARIQRLRAGLGLNYTAVGVVLDLLDRIDALEAALRARPASFRR